MLPFTSVHKALHYLILRDVNHYLVKSAREVENTDCIYADPHLTGILNITLYHRMVRLQFWSSGECGVPFHCHYSQILSDLEW